MAAKSKPFVPSIAAGRSPKIEVVLVVDGLIVSQHRCRLVGSVSQNSRLK